MRVVLLYMTCKNQKEAVYLSRALLSKRLVACTNAFPIRSSYVWKGKMREEREIALLCKTMPRHIAAVQKLVQQIHSYECPCVLSFSANVNKAYGKWVREETS